MGDLRFMHKQRRTPYMTVKFLTGTASHLAEVTTGATPYPYLVLASNVVPCEPSPKKPKLPIPAPKNKGASFFRGDEWRTIGKWSATALEHHISKTEHDLHKIQNKESLQLQVDYIAALRYRLEHPL